MMMRCLLVTLLWMGASAFAVQAQESGRARPEQRGPGERPERPQGQPPPRPGVRGDGERPERPSPREEGVRPERSRPDGPRGGDGPPMGRVPPPGRGLHPPPTEQEMAEVAEFMKRYSPKRWEMYQQLPPMQQERLRHAIVGRYRMLQQLKQGDSTELYELRLNRFQIEDEIFRLMRELRNARGTADEQEVRRGLRAQMEQLVELGFQEQELRLEHMQRQLEHFQARLEDERRDRERLIQARLRALEQEGAEMGDLQPPRGPDRQRP